MLPEFKQMLSIELGGKLSNAERELLPTGFQIIGDIAIVQLKEPLHKLKQEIAEIILKNFPNRIKAVCLKSGEIMGEFREPKIERLAGNGLETVHRENECLFKMDVSKVMFAKGNVNERRRIASLVKAGEIIVDMFAGLGYFTIPIAVLSKAKKIYSIEKNPVAFHYLKENLVLNRVGGKVVPIEGDCVEKAPAIGKIADRVLLGYLPAPKFALPAAFAVAKEGAKMHYEGVWYEFDSIENVFGDVIEGAKKANRKVALEHVQRVKSFGPHRYHVVLDVALD
ncbi:class I SAM-dependent methyltransferase family protein [Candidatus Micrarchaeota archaeon]|nr:class I SAM-dependent methyltransferase family protein [Candidatus Micrarchaeota archaeon]